LACHFLHQTKISEEEFQRIDFAFAQNAYGSIDDSIAVVSENNMNMSDGSHIAPAPEHVERMTEALLLPISVTIVVFHRKIANFHLGFETIHRLTMATVAWSRALEFSTFAARFPQNYNSR